VGQIGGLANALGVLPGDVLSPEEWRTLELVSRILRALCAFLGLLLLVEGWAMPRFVTALPGIILGALAGSALGAFVLRDTSWALLALLGGGALGGSIALAAYDRAVFINGLMAGWLLASAARSTNLALLPTSPLLFLLFGGIIGGIAAVLSRGYWITLVSSALGAVFLSSGLSLRPELSLAAFVLGGLVQYGLAMALGEPLRWRRPLRRAEAEVPGRPVPAPSVAGVAPPPAQAQAPAAEAAGPPDEPAVPPVT
jgi:hypothetical protein